MFTEPDTRYAKSGGVHIAYQILGDGPPDLVVVPEWVTHVEAAWDHPVAARPLRRMASYARLLTFDKRGIGLSDPVRPADVPSLETWMDDLRSVLDAAGSEKAVLLGHGHGGQMALMFAATYPERTESLVLMNAYARLARAPEYDWGVPDAVQDKAVGLVEQFWGTPDSPTLDLIAPSVAGDPSVRQWWARLERMACSPGTAVAMQRAIFGFDVRHILPAVTVPTLVVQNAGDNFVRAEHGRYLAEHIAGATYVEVPGNDHWPWVGAESETALTAVEEFITGGSGAGATDRVLATVLFTDVVGSTGRLAEVGDRKWREKLEDLEALIARQLTRFGGRLVASTGDGALATFGGPGRALHCGLAIRDGVRSLGLEVRTGLHCGEVELRGDDVSGMAVHIAARVMALAAAGEVLVSASVPPLVVGSDFAFTDRGEYELRGVPGRWRLFALGE